jgi:hypothetical protein
VPAIALWTIAGKTCVAQIELTGEFIDPFAFLAYHAFSTPEDDFGHVVGNGASQGGIVDLDGHMLFAGGGRKNTSPQFGVGTKFADGGSARPEGPCLN